MCLCSAPTEGRASPWHLHKACLTPTGSGGDPCPRAGEGGWRGPWQADGKQDEAEEELRCVPSDGDRFGLVLIYPNMWHCHDVHLPESKPPDTCQNTGITAQGSPDTALHAGARHSSQPPLRLAPKPSPSLAAQGPRSAGGELVLALGRRAREGGRGEKRGGEGRGKISAQKTRE